MQLTPEIIRDIMSNKAISLAIAEDHMRYKELVWHPYKLMFQVIHSDMSKVPSSLWYDDLESALSMFNDLP